LKRAQGVTEKVPSFVIKKKFPATIVKEKAYYMSSEKEKEEKIKAINKRLNDFIDKVSPLYQPTPNYQERTYENSEEGLEDLAHPNRKKKKKDEYYEKCDSSCSGSCKP